MTKSEKRQKLFTSLVEKGTLKQKVFQQTTNAFQMFREVLLELSEEYAKANPDQGIEIPVEYSEKGEFEVQLKFAGDVLVFMMHTNVFEFPRDHIIQKTSYVKDDPSRSFCGVINIFNFLRDSFKYRRLNDVGYLLGRVFINKEQHFYIDGKKELRLLPNNFVDTSLDKDKVCDIIEQAMQYTINFDLLTPPYDEIKEVRAMEFLTALDSMRMKTGKRLGFKFQADKENGVG
ncbi:MAG: hypothetical protein RQ761_10780 [Bacteroidales bacterium]|nr:hypothetical protein [Bacteroidales bacterium]